MKETAADLRKWTREAKKEARVAADRARDYESHGNGATWYLAQLKREASEFARKAAFMERASRRANR